MAEGGNPNKIIQSIQRAFDIVECFTNKEPELSLHEISDKVKLNKSTIHGILNTMMLNGYIAQNHDNGKYMLGKKFISKSIIVPSNLLFKNFSEKFVQPLSEKYNATSHLLIYEHKELYTLQLYIPSRAYYAISSIIGKRIPFHATASGKIILAYMEMNEFDRYIAVHPLRPFTPKTITNVAVLTAELAKIRRQGYSLEDEEVEMGVFSIACPIFNQFNRIFATVSISASVSQENNVDEIIADLKDVAKKISAEYYN